MIFRGGERAGFEAGLERAAAAPAGEKAGGEQIAGAGGVDDTLDLRRCDVDALAMFEATAPLAPRVITSVRDVLRQRSMQSARSPQPVR